MNGFLLLLTWFAPLFAALVVLVSSSRWLAPLAALPALLTAILVPAGAHLDVSWLLLGSRFGVDTAGRIFLLFTAMLWLFAALQMELTMRHDPSLNRFRQFLLFAMAGNFWLIIGQDLVNFFLGFALMGLAAYGLVIHNGDPAALRAGRVYLAMTLVAEAALLAAFVLIFDHTGTLVPAPAQLMGSGDWAFGLLIFSLGIKAGFMLLHVWLPLAHPAAPVPASAVLSGAMIKAALIGWMRFLPLGQETLLGWGNLMAIVGTLTVLYAIPVGLVQTNPKVVLAYSSVSKMGLMTAILGLALLAPALSPVIVTALIFYAAHHGLAKGALFLGVGVVRGTNVKWMLMVLIVPALVLAGAPFTSGAMAKALIKPPLTEIEGLWAGAMPVLLIVSTIGTTMLMVRFLTLMRTGQSSVANATRWIAAPWLILIGLILALPFFTGFTIPPAYESWPLIAGAGLALLTALLASRWGRRIIGSIPAGDLLELVPHLTKRIPRLLGSFSVRGYNGSAETVVERVRQLANLRLLSMPSLEVTLRLWPVAGTLALAICGALLFLLWI